MLLHRVIFMWEGGIKDTSVHFVPSKQGRFYVSWVPDVQQQNRFIIKNGMKVSC